MGLDDTEVWIGSGSFSDPLRTATHSSHRRKRQNCGSSSEEHHSAAAPSIGQLGFGAMTSEESPNSSGQMFAGIHRVVNQGSRLNSRGLPFNAFEPGSSSNARFSFSNGVPPDGNWNVVSSALQQPVSGHVGSFTNSPYAYGGDQNRNPYKRKSPIDTFPASLTHRTGPCMGENNYLGFTQSSGLRASVAPFNSVCDEAGVRRDGQDAYHFRNGALSVNTYDGFTTTLTRDNYYSPSVVQNERALLAPRRMLPTSNTTVNESVGNMGMGLPETLPSRQGTGLAGAGSWRRNNTFLVENSNQLGFFETARNFSCSNDGNISRQNQAPDMVEISAADSWPLQFPNRAIRPAHLREFTSQSSHLPQHLAMNPYAYVGTGNIHLPPFHAGSPHMQAVFPPPGSATAMSGMAPGPQAAFGDLPSGSMPGQLLPRYNDTNRASYLRQVAFRGSRVFPSDGVNRHRFSASHVLSNQSLAYEWVDAYDQHSDMRLDVDNMSYEELLALEERIGNVNTGLTEDNVHKCLKTSIYACDATPLVNFQESDTKCSICQEEYAEADELGELQCGHAYHTDCIKQWLLLKNQCPICKAAAS